MTSTSTGSNHILITFCAVYISTEFLKYIWQKI